MNVSVEIDARPPQLRAVEISVKGRWVTVPALDVAGHTVITTGTLIKTAAIKDEWWMEHRLDDPEMYIRTLKELGAECQPDIFTFVQRLPETEPRYPYHAELNSVAAIRLTMFEEWWKHLSSDTRRNVKLARNRGVITRVERINEDLVKGIVAMNNESPVRAGKPFWHYGKTFDDVMKDYSSFASRSEYICAYFQDELIAFIKIVYSEDVASIMQNLSTIRHRDKRAAIAVMSRAVERCAERRLSFLTYLQYRYGNKQDDSLTEFKRRCGFDEILTPQFYVPLTTKGRLAIAAGLHRPLGETLPGPMLNGFIWLRRNWYKGHEKR